MRLGVAGCGRIGGMHARVLRDRPDVDELVLTDSDNSCAERLAAEVGGHAVDTFDELLRAGVDGVLVTTGSGSHAELVLAAVQAGVPVLCEKPLALDLPGTLAVVSAADASGVPVQVGFQRRFDPGYVRARQVVGSGELGWLHTVRACTLDAGPPPAGYLAGSGGIHRDCGVHDYDAIRWVTGREVDSVLAVGANRGDPSFREQGDVDTAAVVLTLDDGTLGTVSLARYNGAGYDVRLELLGSAGSLAVGLDEGMPLSSAEPAVTFPGGPAWGGFRERFAAAYRAEVSAFLALLRQRGPNLCPPREALAALLVAEAAEQSARTGQPVHLEPVRA